MIWRWLICFSAVTAAANGATVTGTVELRDSRVSAVVRQKDFSGVVISATQVGGLQSPLAPGHAVMHQKGKVFQPHILPVTAGTAVDFPNDDLIFHNAFSSFNGQIFDVGLYPPGASRTVRFARSGAVRVFCNIHPSMSAVILVLDTPWFAQTARDGSWKLDLPAGEYEVRFFHERATPQSLAGLTTRISVGPEALHTPTVSISEAGYIVADHKNKYGHEYGPSADDQILYPTSLPRRAEIGSADEVPLSSLEDSALYRARNHVVAGCGGISG